MFNKLLSRFIRPRHYWRDAGFDELTELYVSMMFRSLAMGLIGIFVPIYLYQHGSEVWEILIFFMYVFLAQLITNILSAFIIARIGPKHTILISYFIQAIALCGLFYIDSSPLPLPILAMFFGAAQAMFYTAFHVDFSKVKHSNHGGKEVGWMYMLQKVGTVLGPLVGGVIAYFFGAQYIFAIALGLMVLGLIPLFLTSEPMKTHQKLDFRKLKLSSISRDVSSYSALLVDNAITFIIWPLFVGVMIFQDNPYIQLGGVASLSFIASLLTARAIGVMIDKKKGRSLLRAGASINAVAHLFRPFANGFPSVLAINLVNESVTIAYTMPMTKGMYDSADEQTGHRIVYISTLEAVGNLCRLLFFACAALVAFYLQNMQTLFMAMFFFGAIPSLLIMSERFKALKG